MNASLATSTEVTYRRAWRLFSSFSRTYLGCQADTPVPVPSIALFVAYMHGKNMSVKTISTYLSGISYIHKLASLPNPTDSFMVSSLVRGAQRLAPSYDMRLPITVPILDKLVHALQSTCQSIYYYRLFVSMFLFAFNAFARCSELTYTTASAAGHILRLSDVSIQYRAGQPDRLSVCFHSYKHSNRKTHCLEFSHGCTSTSPVRAMHSYVQHRGSHDGPLFTLPSEAPVPRHLFDKQLRSALKFWLRQF